MEFILTPLLSNPRREYKPANGSNPLFLVLCAIVASGITLFLGYGYSMLTLFIPIVYLNVILTIVFGFGMGYLCYFLCHFFRIKKNSERLAIFLLAAFIGYYANWIVYVHFAMEGYPSPSTFISNLHLFYRPDIVINILAAVTDEGMWDMFGAQVNGFVLVGIWMIEALIIFFLVYKVNKEQVARPFSEVENKWFPEFELLQDFGHVSAAQQFGEEFEINVKDALRDLGKGLGTRYSKVSLFYLPAESKAYVSINNLVPGEKRGQGQKSSPVLRYYEIPPTIANDLFDEYGQYEKKMLSPQ